MKIVVALFVTLNFCAVVVPEQKSPGCLAYEPVVVEIKGKIIRKTYPGPPNYESIKRGDRPEVAWLLVLSEPICMQEDEENPATNIAQTGISEVQMVFIEADAYKKYKSFVGSEQHVIATGTLFGSVTGHHHTFVLITVKSLSKAA